MSSPRRLVTNSPRTTAPLKGLFKDGSWHCDCDNRPHAAKRETKKEGPNKGRWFYTCSRGFCRFFLWSDEAKVRENTVNVVGARSHNDQTHRSLLPSTPTKYSQPRKSYLLTPQTERKAPVTPANNQFKIPPLSAKALMMAEDDYGWNDDSDENDELSSIMFQTQAEPRENAPFFSPRTPSYLPETPSKVLCTPQTTSPGKRKCLDYKEYANPSLSTVKGSPAHSLFSSTFPPSSIEMYQTPTPSKYRDVLSSTPRTDNSDLAEDAIAILEKHNVVLPNEARNDLVAHLNKEKIKASGISRGRDILREKTKKLEIEIATLKELTVTQQAQLEMYQTEQSSTECD